MEPIIEDSWLNACIVGLGFVGLPLAKRFLQSGAQVTGIDLDEKKVLMLQAGKSYVSDVSDDELRRFLDRGKFICTNDYAAVAGVDVVIVCVPTPLTATGVPDLTSVINAVSSIASHLRQGQLFILESSTYPGTTEELVVPRLEKSGLKAGIDFYVAYSPERINPGDEERDLSQIPKVVSGINAISLEKIIAVYSKIFSQVFPVSTPRVAEFTKLLENTQRFINISMMNELAMACEEWHIDLWESIAAASTKPFGFAAYYPGPGIGGHCIPVDPIYLLWFGKQNHQRLQFIQTAQQINEQMPRYVARRILRLALVPAPKILAIGVTYKADVNDLRESASLRVIEELVARGAEVEYSDPFVPELNVRGHGYVSLPLTPEHVRSFDVVAILTDHSAIDYELIQIHASAVFDARHVYKGQVGHNVTQL